MLYDDNRYEVEEKYTQFINLTSRPVWPRLDMRPLAALLNKFEARYSGAAAQATQQEGGAAAEMVWVANGLTDTGEGLRVSACSANVLG